MSTNSKKLQSRKQPTSLLMQSANGTLYNAIEVDLLTREKVRDVVVKFFPKSSVRTYVDVKGIRCPSEIYFHVKAFSLARPFIVEPLDWIEREDDFAIAVEKPERTMVHGLV
ncbi:Oidioi.mRNA.OKI2018_I69.chr2.g5908.t1.cds [Oikopleura dioica]|uniref:Oidioi.mRNA.OKI2018_I69.chr2.g5908.t1.cds n=1 Tax=Oikopleura dioica TaxID=34765 RepID=A0ABN7T632_OIKDI|nr:Oidioi.mRNA.OKI2018_I69.chr2.g5908.t1.cds [Oikopleura dioica]